MKTYSLRVKLLKSISVPLFLYILVIGLLGYFIAKHEINEVYDSQLITAANVLWFLSESELEHNDKGAGSIDIDDMHLGEKDKEPFNEYAERRQFRIWKNNNIFINSENSLPPTKKAFKSGFSNFKFNHMKWRVYSLHINDNKAVIEVAEAYEARHELVANIILGLILPFLASLPLVVFLLSRVLRYALKGIEKTAAQIEARSPNDMSPLAISEIPKDLLPLTRAMDSLLLRIKIALKREREFIDNAAHSLKTPLAALKIQAQLIDKVKTASEKEEGIKDLLKSTDRASRLVDQLLISSRIENHKYDLYPVSLTSSLANSVRLVKLLADKKSIKIQLAEPKQEKQIMGDDELISILFMNILDNAIKYSPQKAVVNVKVENSQSGITVAISDSGPGIKESEKDNITKRFSQASKNQESGNGLGLAIASQIVELLDAEMTIENEVDKTGLVVTLSFKTI